MYEKKMPLTAEIDCFLNHLDGKKLEKSDVNHGLEVVEILVNVSQQLIR